MSPTTTLAAYAAVLALVFGGGLALGRVVGPVGTAATSHGSPMTGTDHTGVSR